MRFLQLQQDQLQCPTCPLVRTCQRTYIKTEVHTDSAHGEKPSADILFVVDYPSYQDDRQRSILSNDTGRIVKQHIEQNAKGLRYAIAHLVRCRPVEETEKGGSRAPTQIEIDTCSEHVRQDIRTLGVKVVVLMGVMPLMALNPDPKDMTWAAGAVMEARRRGTKVANGVTYFVIPNPSIIAVKQSQQALILGDITRAIEAARGVEDPFSRKGRTVLIDTVEKFKAFKKHLLYGLTAEDYVACDTETLNVNRVAENRVLTWQFAYDTDVGYVVPYEHGESPWTKEELENIIRPGLHEIFSAKDAAFGGWVMHNAPFEADKIQRFLQIYRIARPIWDTQFGAYTLDENRVNFDFGKQSKKGFGPMSLKTLAPEWLNFYHYKDEADALEARNAGLISMLPFKKLVEYGGMDAYVTLRLRLRILEMAERSKYKANLDRFVLKWFNRAIPVSPMIERNGIVVDRKQLAVLRSDASPILLQQEKVKQELYALPETQVVNKLLLKTDGRTAGMQALFGPPPWMFDMSKKTHLISLFLDQLGLVPIEFGKQQTEEFPDGVPSIDKKFFATYKEDHRAVALVSESKGLEKLRTSYLSSIEEFLSTHPDMQDGRVRASLLWTRTVTNRLSQKDPNNSQLPRPDNEYKKAIKALYRAAPRCVLIEGDYSQAEIRWWAQISNDVAYEKSFKLMEEMRAELAADPTNAALAARVELECDVHRQSAALMYRKPIADVTKDERQAVKNIVFGSIYGQHVATLAQILKISVKKAEELQKSFFKAVPHAAQWLQDIERSAQRLGYVEDAFGRRRHLRMELDSRDPGIAQRALRQARNSPIQSSSSNMMILAACNVNDHIVEKSLPYKLENLVHDAMLLEVPLDLQAIKDACSLLRTKMTATAHLKNDWGLNMKIPFEVDFKVGLSWGFAKTVGVVPGKTVDDLYKYLVEAARAEGQEI